ncbi:hypothetical protein KXT47_26285, partial [Salmonella enterica subsp. enterica serovar Weltevreden]|nr:hypothetical protein [Salmonella enterica subsp. enterica serovar Weltevreden]
MRIFGAPLARRIIFAVMIPALLVSYVVSSLFYMGAWQGFAALADFNLFVARLPDVAGRLFRDGAWRTAHGYSLP